MSWKLLLRPTLAVCAFFSLMWVPGICVMPTFGEPVDSSYAPVVLPGLLLLCAFVVPPLMVASKVQTKRFLHGLVVGCAGWTLGLVASILVSTTTWTLYYSRRPDAPTVDQGVAIYMLIAWIWIAGVVTSPGMGILSEVAGIFHDRRRAKLVGAAVDEPLVPGSM